MKQPAPILLLIACLVIIPSQAQTPYDAFAPETSRPMLGLEAVSSVSSERLTAVESMSDSAVFAIVIDPKQQSVYLLNLVEHTLLAAAPLTDDVLKWLSVDPLSDKYPNISPYAYCAWNPIKYVDPNGEMITITGDNGETVTYVPGKQYEGDDHFTKRMWSQIDAIANTKSGGTVVSELVDDEGPAFSVTSQVAKSPNSLEVKGYVIGQRLLKMGGEDEGAESLAHEFFHAYQDLYGYGGASCANDVEAYIFQGIVSGELYNIEPFGLSATGQLMPTDNQSVYYNTYMDIMHDCMLNADRLNNLAKGFNVFSRAGANGIAKNYTTFSKNQQYRILKFWGK